MSYRIFRSADLFAGAGGLSLGVSRAGFRHELLLEFDRSAVATLRTNRQLLHISDEKIVLSDVRRFDFSVEQRVDLLVAGAPCQPFSIAGKHRTFADSRNLFPEVFRAVEALRPSAVVVENVRGMLRSSLAEFVRYIELRLSHPFVLPAPVAAGDSWQKDLKSLEIALGQNRHRKPAYAVHRLLLNAADFGVAQKRERLFFIALRKDVAPFWTPPAPTHSKASLKAIGKYGVQSPRRTLSADDSESELLPWRTVADALRGLPKPARSSKYVRVAGHILQPGARSYPGHTGSPLHLPAKTLKAGVHGVPGGENMVRFNNGMVRYFTVREAARIQGFPDTYAFPEVWSQAMRQIGNAVPVPLAEAVATSVKNALRASER